MTPIKQDSHKLEPRVWMFMTAYKEVVSGALSDALNWKLFDKQF